MTRIPINHDAINQYRRIRDINARYSIAEECSHCDFFNQGVSDDASWISAASCTDTITDWSVNSPPVSPKQRSPRRGISKYHSGQNPKSLKDKSPTSVDRSLRSQGWVGGHTPYGFKKPKRTWKLKNPTDEVYLTKICTTKTTRNPSRGVYTMIE